MGFERLGDALQTRLFRAEEDMCYLHPASVHGRLPTRGAELPKVTWVHCECFDGNPMNAEVLSERPFFILFDIVEASLWPAPQSRQK